MMLKILIFHQGNKLYKMYSFDGKSKFSTSLQDNSYVKLRYFTKYFSLNTCLGDTSFKNIFNRIM